MSRTKDEGKKSRNRETATGVVFKLVGCRHTLTSTTQNIGDLQTCFDCGSTRRKDAFDGEEWLSPWAWRELCP